MTSRSFATALALAALTFTAAPAAAGTAGDPSVTTAFAWRVASGAWEGVALDGLTVSAIVPGRDPSRAAAEGAVITVDLRANALQRAALVSLARELSGGRISDIARVQSTPVRFGTARHYAEVRAEELLLRSSRRRLAEPEAGR